MLLGVFEDFRLAPTATNQDYSFFPAWPITRLVKPLVLVGTRVGGQFGNNWLTKNLV